MVQDPAQLYLAPGSAGGDSAVPDRCRLVAQRSCPSWAATLPPLATPGALLPGPHGDSLFPLGDSGPLTPFQHLARPFPPPPRSRPGLTHSCSAPGANSCSLGGAGGERRDWQHVRGLGRSPAGPGGASTQDSGLLGPWCGSGSREWGGGWRLGG